MREKEGYRDVIEHLNEHFNGRNLLTVKDVAEYCGRTPKTVKALYDIPPEGIVIPLLARKMCK